jgi:hypothetical protein
LAPAFLLADFFAEAFLADAFFAPEDFEDSRAMSGSPTMAAGRLFSSPDRSGTTIGGRQN